MGTELPIELKPGLRRSVEKMVAQCQELVGEGEVVRLAFPAKKGIGSSSLVLLSWFTQVLLVFQQFRVVAVTDTAIVVFKSGWFTRVKPGKLLHTLPRDTPLALGRGGRLQLGPEKVRVSLVYRPVIEAASQVTSAE